MKALILTAFLCFSCTRYAEIKKDAVGVEIAPVQMDISHLKEIEWNVGLKKEETVSQSFTFIVDLPKIKEDDVDYLVQNKSIDAWILRLIVNRGSEVQDLGSLYTLLRPERLGRGSSGDAPTSVTFKVFYAAAYASERFRSFKCPAFGHDRKLKDIMISGENDDFSLPLGPSAPYNEKSHRVELTPTAFNGGNSLVGNYYVEIATYDSKKKIIHSPFKRIPVFVSVKSEERIQIASCGGIHQEYQ